MSRLEPTDKKILKICKAMTLVSFVLMIGSIVFRIYCANQISVKNEELRDLFAYEKELNKEITRLEYVDTNLSSISEVEVRARKMGFVDNESALLSINTDTQIPVAALSN